MTRSHIRHVSTYHPHRGGGRDRRAERSVRRVAGVTVALVGLYAPPLREFSRPSACGRAMGMLTTGISDLEPESATGTFASADRGPVTRGWTGLTVEQLSKEQMRMTAKRRVVVGVDGSDGSSRALRWAASEARENGAELSVVTAYRGPSPRLSTEAGSAPWLERTDWRGKAKATLKNTVRDTLGEDPGVTLKLTLAEGSAAKALIDLSADADLLVVGTRGHGGFTGMLLGSVSQHVTAHAHCAVVVVR